jgi:caffeoyl-CoA O-methyltransferase
MTTCRVKGEVKMIDPKIVNPDVLNYLQELTPDFPEIFKKIEILARQEGHPIVSKDSGKFLNLMVKITGAQKILEIGCSIGFSGMWLASALPPNGRLDTLEINKETVAKAQKNFEEGNVANKVFIHTGAALDLLPGLEGPYDIVFIDAVKSEYKDYLRLSLPKLKHGGLILVDNVLWSGKVASKNIAPDDNTTRAICEFNEYFLSHPELESLILTIGDGLGFAIKKAG